MKILPFLYGVRTQNIIFDAVEYKQRYHETYFVLGDVYLTPLSQCEQYLSVQHMDKLTSINVILKIFVISLCGVVGSPSSFIIFLVDRTGKIWSVVCINAK